MKRETYSNYHLINKFNLIQTHSRIDNIFLTLEGHGYEEQIFTESLKNDPRTRIWFRQHSPISLAQVGVFNMLGVLEKPIFILTTGSAYSELFNKYSVNVVCFVIGTSKTRYPSKISADNRKILVAPEGTEKSTLDFLQFLDQLDFRFDEYEFVFRVHPDIVSKRRISNQIKKNLKKHNFNLSSNSLDLDLLQTSITLYRSSAVAVESLAFNNLPVYLNFDDNLNLNVFSIFNNVFPYLKNIFDQSSFLDILKIANKTVIDQEIYDKIFQSLDHSAVSEYFLMH
jgi:hypothetical protein